MSRKRATQISVSFDDDLYSRLKAAARINDHAAAQLARILIEAALPMYERCRNVEELQEYAQRVCAEHLENLDRLSKPQKALRNAS